ncbi:hypothetical protein, partial [Salipiger mangrovisoli]|uniref:hypothetical protein n=1 Tax=Salipiger mangrovisoli TaxID=2865933 RepID=UPI001F11BDB3
AHLHHASPGLAGIFAVKQGVDSDHESRVLKNFECRHFDAKARQFSGSLVDLVKRRRTGV